MKTRIANVQDIGPWVRAARKAQGLRQDDAAGSIGVSENFLGKVESGNGSVNLAKLFQVLDGLGIDLWLDIPDDVAEQFPVQPTEGSQR